MLGVAPLGRDRAGYYLDDLGDELARVGPAGTASVWTGRGAGDLGLRGPVSPAGFRALLGGEHPGTGRRLVQRTVTVGAFDLTFSAPKPVSLLFALGAGDTPRHVVAAHRSAVDAVGQYLETRVLSVRRRAGEERRVLPTDGMVGAAFLHCLSRTGDPHLHTHLVVSNLAHGVDGRWSALDGRALYAHRGAAGALFEAHLRGELTTRLGVTWHRRDRGFEPDGFDVLLGASFSGRGAEVRQAAAEAGARSPRGHRIAWAATRGPKDRRSGEVLRREWSRRSHGLGPIATARTHHHDRAPSLDEHRFAAALAHQPGGVTRRDIVAAWAGAAEPGGNAVDIDRAVEHWAPALGAIGVTEPRRAPADCVPGPHLLSSLGPRPLDAAGQPVWRAAAAAIEHYRSRWGLSGERAPRDEDRRVMPARQLAEHIELERAVREALVRMGGLGRPGWARDGPALERS